MPTIARQIKSELDKVEAEAKEKWAEFAKARQAALDAGKNLAEDKETFDALHELNKGYSTVADRAEQLREQLVKAFEMDGDPPKGRPDDPGREDPEGTKAGTWSPGLRVVQSDAYKAWVKENEAALLSGSNTGPSVKMPRIAYADREEFKALLTGLSRTSAGAFLTPDRLPGYLDLLQRELFVRNLVTVGDTDSDIVEWVRETTFTNAAAETAEATATTGTSGTKPESALAYDVVQSTVQTIAHWIPATKRALADVGQLRTLIDSRLQDGVNLRLDSQMVNGDATGANLRGILNTTGVNAIAVGGTEPPVEALLRAMTQVRLAFMEPSAVMVHPADFEQIRLARDTTGNYFFGPPTAVGAETVWGKRIVQSGVVPQNTAIVAKWDEAILWVREGVNTSASDSHSDFFVRNMVALLAEGRFAFAIPRPAAFSVVTGV